MRIAVRFQKPEWFVLAATLAIGIWIALYFQRVGTGLGETAHAARVLLVRGELADPYVIPTGPTAHVSPVVAAMIAASYWIAGLESDGWVLPIRLATAGLYSASAFVAIQLLQAHGVSLAWRWIAACTLALPFRLYQSVIEYSTWDQPLAALLLLLGWLATLRVRTGADPWRGGLYLGALTGFGGLVSPALLVPFGLAFVWITVLTSRHQVSKRWWSGALAGAFIASLFLVPWATRNHQVLGSFVLRSNFPLELAVGNAPSRLFVPAAASSLDSSDLLQLAHNKLHPFRSVGAAQRVRQVGEIAFMREKRRQAWEWINEDPEAFTWRSLDRARFALFPPAEEATKDYFPLLGPIAPVSFVRLIGGLLVFALIFTIVIGRDLLLEAVLFIFLPLAPYLITQMNMRYTFLVYFTTIVCVVIALQRLSSRCVDRITQEDRPGVDTI